MAGRSRNSRSRVSHDHQEANKRPRQTTLIACRICNQVFGDTQAFIDHIETHVSGSETPFAAPPSLPCYHSPTFQPGTSLYRQSGYNMNLPSMQERNMFAFGEMEHHPPMIPFSATNNSMLGAYVPLDYTKQLLQHPSKHKPSKSEVNAGDQGKIHEMAENESKVETLDLTLKL